MSMVQVSLDQVLSALEGSLRSIDLRAAVVQTEKIQSLVTGIRISSRSVSAIKDRHAKLVKDLGRGEAGSFKVLYHALPLSSLDTIQSELRQGMLTFVGQKIFFPQVIMSPDLRGNIRRDHHVIRAWDASPVPAFYSYLRFTPPVSHPDLLTADIRRAFGVRSVTEVVDAFLELNYSGQESVDFFVYVEMPARIADVSLTGRTVRVQVEAEKHLGSPRLCVNTYDSSGLKLLESRIPGLELIRDDGPFVLLGAEATFSSVRDNDHICCVLTHDLLPELDEITNRNRDLARAEERNPLLESVRKFWDINKVYEQAVQPFFTKPAKVHIGPQDVFQKAIARLLNLAGFQAFDLERKDKIYHAGTKVEQATVDLLAYHPSEKILLLGACTIGVPKTEDYEKLLHAREIFKASLTPEIPLYIAPVLFTMQENISPFRADMATAGLRILNTRDLEALTRHIDSGHEVKFIYFLKSLSPTALADMT